MASDGNDSSVSFSHSSPPASMLHSFADNFWGVWSDAGPFRGFSVLASHLKQVRREVKEVGDFFRERALIEEEYARKLVRLGTSPLDQEGFGVECEVNPTLKAAYLSLRTLTEAIGNRHLQIASDVRTKIVEQLVLLEAQTKAMTIDHVRLVEEKQRRFRELNSVVPGKKRSYESLCKELDGIKDELASLASSPAKNVEKATEKLNSKMAKTQKDIDNADKAYKQAVDALEPARVEWEDATTMACHLFEGIDMNRIHHIRDRLNDFVALQESHASFVRSQAETQRDYNDCIKEEVDIEMFVSSYRTGYSRPGPVLYVNYYTGLQKDAVFGLPLDKHLETSGRRVPKVLQECVAVVESRGMDGVGVYRTSGRAQRIRQLRALSNKGTAIDSSDTSIQVNDATSVLKLYLRELPNPLLTFEAYDNFVQAAQIEDSTARIARIGELVANLPAAHRTTLSFLMQHLGKVAANSEENKMSAHNLAIVFAPGIVRSRDDNAAMKDLSILTKLVEELITHVDVIFKQE